MMFGFPMHGTTVPQEQVHPVARLPRGQRKRGAQLVSGDGDEPLGGLQVLNHWFLWGIFHIRGEGISKPD